MTIRYVKWLPIASLIVGVLTLVLAILVTQEVLSMIVGALLTLLGVLMLVNPMVRIDADQVRLVNQFGMTIRRFPVSSPADLRIDGKVLRHVAGGDKKIISLGFAADQADVAALKAVLTPSA